MRSREILRSRGFGKSQRIGPKAAMNKAMMANHFICTRVPCGTKRDKDNAGSLRIDCQSAHRPFMDLDSGWESRAAEKLADRSIYAPFAARVCQNMRDLSHQTMVTAGCPKSSEFYWPPTLPKMQDMLQVGRAGSPMRLARNCTSST